MGQTNHEHLKKMLAFLRNEIIHEPENKWFVDELHKMLPHAKHKEDDNPVLSKIERYLALDFKIDSEESPCDYSFLDPFMQEIAESDFREMKRFQLGLRGHKIDFREFCRYVVLQVELILNFFYDEFYKKDISKILDNVIEYNKKGNKKYYDPNREYINSIEDIPFNYKLWAFKKQYLKEIELIDYAKKLRNEASHRSAKPDKFEIEYTRENLIKKGIKFKNDGRPDYNDYNILHPDVLSELKKYKYEFFLLQQDFIAVEKELKYLIDTVYNLISQIEP